MAVPNEIAGTRVGILTVISVAYSKNGRYWNCLCDCGIECVVKGSLLTGSTRNGSCGCLGRENWARIIKKQKEDPQNRTHGMSRHRLDSVMDNMIKRCENPTNKRWDQYGGKGVKICQEWRHDRAEFYRWALENGYEDGLSIDRIDVNGDYDPSNCRWATAREQANNTTRNRILEWNGRSMTVSDWARELGVRGQALQHRVTRGWDNDRIFTQPFRGRNGRA